MALMHVPQAAGFHPTSDEAKQPQETTLEKRWAEQYPRLATLSSALNERIDGLLNQLVDPDSDPDSILHTSRALDVLQQQLATIVQARLRWFAEQETVETTYARLTPADLYRVTDSQGSLPPELTVTKPREKHDLEALIAITDEHRPAHKTDPGTEPVTDRIRIRRCRPVTIGVYLPKDTSSGTWQLEPSSVRVMDVVDEFSPIDELSLDGSWLHKRKASLAFHNDMSLSTFGFSTTPTMSTAVSSGGDLLNALSTAGQYWANRPTDQERQLERMTTQLNLLQTATDYEILAATSARSAELAVLEQQSRRRDAIGG
jgi:hypothetical protein